MGTAVRAKIQERQDRHRSACWFSRYGNQIVCTLCMTRTLEQFVFNLADRSALKWIASKEPYSYIRCLAQINLGEPSVVWFRWRYDLAAGFGLYVYFCTRSNDIGSQDQFTKGG